MEDEQHPSGAQGRARRFGWLVVIWALSVGALALVAAVLKGIMKLVGMTN